MMPASILEYSINFKSQEQCNTTHQALNHLCEDDYSCLKPALTSVKSEHLLSNALEGLMVFLTCEREANILTGSFYTSDLELDKQVFQDFIDEQSHQAENVVLQMHSHAAIA